MKRLFAIVLIMMVIATFPVSASSLKQGDSSDQVMKLQQALIDGGYLTGIADGQFGPMTEEAVRNYQEESGVTADGIINDIQYLNLTYESIDNPGKIASDYEFADWAQFVEAYERVQVRGLQNYNYYVQDYIGKKLSDFCFISDNRLCGTDYFGEVVFELANFGDKFAGVPIESEGDLYNYTVVYQDPMPDLPVSLGSSDKLTVRLGVIYSKYLNIISLPQYNIRDYVGLKLSEFGRIDGLNFYDEYDGKNIYIKFIDENGIATAIADSSDLARYTVVSQNYPAGTQFTITSSGPEMNGSKMSNIKLTVRETTTRATNPVDISTFTRQPANSSDNFVEAPSYGGGSSQMVWVSETGSCYHSYDHCGNMNPMKASQITVEQARGRGLKKCSNCW